MKNILPFVSDVNKNALFEIFFVKFSKSKLANNKIAVLNFYANFVFFRHV